MAQASKCSSTQALNRLIDRRGSAVPYSAVRPQIFNSGKASSLALPGPTHHCEMEMENYSCHNSTNRMSSVKGFTVLIPMKGSYDYLIISVYTFYCFIYSRLCTVLCCSLVSEHRILYEPSSWLVPRIYAFMPTPLPFCLAFNDSFSSLDIPPFPCLKRK